MTFSRSIEAERETIGLAQDLAPLLKPGDLLILSGGLGAGKTFFSGALAVALGLDPDERVTSPTYALVCEYETRPALCHADLYRLGHEDELWELGLEERRQQGHLLVVEWGKPYVAALGGDAIELELNVDPRTATIREQGPRSREVIAALGQ